MKITKQKEVQNEIIRSVTHGEKKSGDVVLARDYDLAKMQMGKVFKTLSDKGIVEQTNTNSYVLTEDCVANAQEFYFSEIREAIAELKNLAEVANIAPDLLIDVLKGEITA